MGSGQRGNHLNVTVLGCGEAFDERLANTSLLVRTSGATMLLDCGWSVPSEVWRRVEGADAIDLIYLSHSHADHTFGLPALLGRMWEDGRTKRLLILTQPAVYDAVNQIMDLGYGSLRRRFQFPIEFCLAEANRSTTLLGADFHFAPTRHSASNLAVRIEADGQVLCYSGDGGATDESRALYHNAGVLVHEAWGFEPSEMHSHVSEALDVAAHANVRRLALVHVRRSLRRERDKLVRTLLTSSVRCLLPEPGAVLPF